MSTWSADAHHPANLSPTSTAAVLPPLSSSHLMTQGWPQNSGNGTPNAHAQTGNGSVHSAGATHERYLPIALQPNSAVGPPGAGNSSPAYALGPPAIQPSGLAMSSSDRSSGETSRFAYYPGDVHGSAPARDIKTSGSTGSWTGTEQATSPVMATPAQQSATSMEHGYSGGGHQSQRSFDSTNSHAAYGSMHTSQQSLPSVSYGKHRYSAPSTVSGQYGGYERGPSPPQQGYNGGSEPDSPRAALAGSASFGAYGAGRGVPLSTQQRPYPRPASPTYAQMTGHGSAHMHSLSMAGSTSHAWGTATGADAHQTAHAPSAGHGYYGAPLTASRSVLQMPSTPQYGTYAGHHGVPLEVPSGYSSVQAASYPAAQSGVSIVSDPYGNPTELRTHYLNPFEVKHRRRTTKAQFKVLEGTFQETPKPTAAARKEIAEQLGMPLRAVQIWFQNRRAKAKVLARKEAEKAAEQQKERNNGASGEQSHLAGRKMSGSSSGGGRGGGGPGSVASGSTASGSQQTKRRADDSPEQAASGYHGAYHVPASHHPAAHTHQSMHPHSYSSHLGSHSLGAAQHHHQQQHYDGPSSSSPMFGHHHTQEEHHERATQGMLPRYGGIYEPAEGSAWRS